MNKIALYLFFLILLVGCKTQTYEQTIKSSIECYLDTTRVNYEYVMLIPNSGCTGCISDAEYMFKEYNDRNEILFIFTHVMSEKGLRIRLGKENLQRRNVLIDKDNKFYFGEFQESIYPIVAVIKSKKIVALKDHILLREIYPPKD